MPPTFPSSHTERLHGDDPRALSKHAISLLEKRLYADFGLSIRIGAELEFTVVPRTSCPPQDAPYYTASGYPFHNDALQLKSFAPANEHPPHTGGNFVSKGHTSKIAPTSNILFPQSPWVCRTYEELGIGQYEVVLSHLARHRTLPAEEGRRAIALARAIEALKNTLQHDPLQSKRRYAKDSTHDAALRTLSQEWTSRFDLTTWDKHREEYTQNHHGLHINISLLDSHDRPLSEAFYTDDLLAHAANFGRESAYLLLPDKASVDRLTWREGRNLKVKNNEESRPEYADEEDPSIPDSLRLEFSLASASSDPYYATLLALGGIYDALQHPHEHFSPPPPSSPVSIDSSKKQFLEGSRSLQNLLDSLEPNLGKRFEAAVLASPPQRNLSPSSPPRTR